MELERLVAAIRRRWMLVAAAVAVGALIGAYAASRSVERSTAEATIAVNADRTVYGSERVLERLVANELAFIDSADLRLATLATLGIGTDVDPDVDMQAAQRTDTDVVDLRVTSSTPAVAIRTVNAWAAAWVDEGNARKTAQVDALLADLRTELGDAEDALAGADAAITDALARNRIVELRDLFVVRPDLAAEQRLRTTEVRRLQNSISTIERRDARTLPYAIVSTAETTTERSSGNGLGAPHGALIGLGIALALITTFDRSTLSARSAMRISDTVWPETRRIVSRRSIDRTDRIAQEVLRSMPGDGLQLIAFSGADDRSTALKGELASHFASCGFDVTLLVEDQVRRLHDRDDGVVEMSHDRLSDIVDLAAHGGRTMRESLVLADFTDLWFQRALVESTSIVAVIHLTPGADDEVDAAAAISRAHALAPAVLTIAA